MAVQTITEGQFDAIDGALLELNVVLLHLVGLIT